MLEDGNGVVWCDLDFVLKRENTLYPALARYRSRPETRFCSAGIRLPAALKCDEARALRSRGRGFSKLFEYPKFDVELSRQMRLAELGWPEPGEAANERGLGCNRAYMDLRRPSWTEARKVLADEAQFIARIENAEDPGEEHSIIEEEYDESGVALQGLDIGVASTVVALSAARCVPFSSCNAGTFGGNHYEVYPVVAFYAKPETANLLLAIATEVDIGMGNGGSGCLVLFSDDIRKFPMFAVAMIRRRTEFNALQLSAPRAPAASAGSPQSGQYELPLQPALNALPATTKIIGR